MASVYDIWSVLSKPFVVGRGHALIGLACVIQLSDHFTQICKLSSHAINEFL